MNSSENADIPSDLEYSDMPNNGRMGDEMSDRLTVAERIREAFMDGAFTYEWSLENGEVFDRWLAQVKAQVWDEGFDAGVDHALFKDFVFNPYSIKSERAQKYIEKTLSEETE